MEQTRIIIGLCLLMLLCSCRGEEIIPVQQTRQPEPAARFDLNRVTARQLSTIPALPSDVEERILDMQKQLGFRRVEDLLSIRGIGLKTYERIRPWFYVDREQ